MERIEIACENGHRLNAGHQSQGKTLPCPKCGVAVKVPQHAFESTPDPLSDTGVMRILGASTSFSAEPMVTAAAPLRACPRCEAGIPLSSSVCEHCQCYLGSMPDFMKDMARKT